MKSLLLSILLLISVSAFSEETKIVDAEDNGESKALHGCELIHPFIKNRKMIVVTDDILVDMNFGTGAVKVTPAHDPNDFECGKRNNLPQISTLDDAGNINENGGELFKNLPRFIVRNKIIDELKKLNLYKGKKDNPMSVGFCSRSKDIVEPRLKPQWYVNCQSMAKRSVNAVKDGDLSILPEFHKKTWYRWLDNIQDWCISRQLWWGHRIPAYQVHVDGKNISNNDEWIVARSKEEALEIAKKQNPSIADKLTLYQDPDVLDTWFSSGLFPFSTMGWPNKDSLDLKKYYPGSLLETGHDILFFWEDFFSLQYHLLK